MTGFDEKFDTPILSRRVLLSTAGAAVTGLALPMAAHGTSPGPRFDSPLLLSADGPVLTPAAFAAVLKDSVSESSSPDTYGEGGATAEIEAFMAKALGKEAALFLPTGTLSNQLAIRILSEHKSHVVVQDQSHVFRDEFDIAQTVSGKTLLNLAPGKADFSADTLGEAIARHPGHIGMVSIETPVRRLLSQRFEFGKLKEISALCRERDIRMHLDGARIFIEAVYTGIPVREYAALFDTVYVCLYKYFGAGGGAVLCGTRDVIAKAAEFRNLFGARLFRSWPYAAVALRFAKGFEERLGQAKARSERVIKRMNETSRFRVESIPNGTNVYRLYVNGASPQIFRQRMSGNGIRWSDFEFTETYGILRVNETWNEIDEDALIDRMIKAST